MITAVLLIYLGISVSAPWWYFVLAGLIFFMKMAYVLINIGKKAGEYIDD